jgi:hypothetical protein
MICYSLYKSILVKIRRLLKKEEPLINKNSYNPIPSQIINENS